MNKHNQGSGSSTPTDVPMKRKRGRPRKEESAVQGDNMPVKRGSDNVMNVTNSNQTEGTTDGAGGEMVGQVVTGVIDGVFDAGYLLNVRVADTDNYLRGAVFLPGCVAPITAENDVVPHLRMVQRKDIPIPVLNPQAQMHSSIPSSGQGSKQPVEPKSLVPNSEDQVLPTEIHSGTSVSLENKAASVAVPMANLPKNDTSISSGGIQQGLSEPGNKSQSVPVMSEMEYDKIVEQDVTLPEPDALRPLKEPIEGEGAKKDSAPPEATNLVPLIENIDKELPTGQEAATSAYKLKEPIHDEPKNLNIELNQMPVSAEAESVPSEQIGKSVDNFVDKQGSPKTDILQDTRTKLASNAGNIFHGGPNPAVETSHTSLFEGEAVPSEYKFASEGSNLPDMNDPQNHSPSGAITKEDAIQPTESLVNSEEPANLL